MRKKFFEKNFRFLKFAFFCEKKKVEKKVGKIFVAKILPKMTEVVSRKWKPPRLHFLETRWFFLLVEQVFNIVETIFLQAGKVIW